MTNIDQIPPFQMENDKHRLLFAQRKMEFLEDFGDSIAALSEAQESHAKIAAQVMHTQRNLWSKTSESKKI